MNVKIKDFPINMSIGSSGIELDISNKDGHVGDLYVTNTQLIWCTGKTQKDNGKKIKMKDFIKYMESLD